MSADHSSRHPAHWGAAVAGLLLVAAMLVSVNGCVRVKEGYSALLVGFVDTQAGVDTDTYRQQRSQIMIWKSMYRQYRDKGLQVVLIDTARPESPGYDRHKFNQFEHDWLLGDISLLQGPPDNRFVVPESIRYVPSTILLDGDNHLMERWDRLVLAHELAPALTEIPGGNRIHIN